jgi:hypothetical protein
VRMRAVLGFSVGALVGWATSSWLLRGGHSSEVGRAGSKGSAAGKPLGAMPLGASASRAAPLKDARSKVDVRLKQLGGRRSKAA